MSEDGDKEHGTSTLEVEHVPGVRVISASDSDSALASEVGLTCASASGSDGVDAPEVGLTCAAYRDGMAALSTQQNPDSASPVQVPGASATPSTALTVASSPMEIQQLIGGRQWSELDVPAQAAAINRITLAIANSRSNPADILVQLGQLADRGEITGNALSVIAIAVNCAHTTAEGTHTRLHVTRTSTTIQDQLLALVNSHEEGSRFTQRQFLNEIMTTGMSDASSDHRSLLLEYFNFIGSALPSLSEQTTIRLKLGAVLRKMKKHDMLHIETDRNSRSMVIIAGHGASASSRDSSSERGRGGAGGAGALTSATGKDTKTGRGVAGGGGAQPDNKRKAVGRRAPAPKRGPGAQPIIDEASDSECDGSRCEAAGLAVGDQIEMLSWTYRGCSWYLGSITTVKSTGTDTAAVTVKWNMSGEDLIEDWREDGKTYNARKLDSKQLPNFKESAYVLSVDSATECIVSAVWLRGDTVTGADSDVASFAMLCCLWKHNGAKLPKNWTATIGINADGPLTLAADATARATTIRNDVRHECELSLQAGINAVLRLSGVCRPIGVTSASTTAAAAAAASSKNSSSSSSNDLKDTPENDGGGRDSEGTASPTDSEIAWAADPELAEAAMMAAAIAASVISADPEMAEAAAIEAATAASESDQSSDIAAQRRVWDLGFTVTDVSHDGHCFAYCVGMVLHIPAAEVLWKTCQEMSNNMHEYVQMADSMDIHGGYDSTTADSQLRAMRYARNLSDLNREIGTYANAAAILACARACKVYVVVHTRMGSYGQGNDEHTPVHVLLNQGHYRYLTKRDEPNPLEPATFTMCDNFSGIVKLNQLSSDAQTPQALAINADSTAAAVQARSSLATLHTAIAAAAAAATTAAATRLFDSDDDVGDAAKKTAAPEVDSDDDDDDDEDGNNGDGDHRAVAARWSSIVDNNSIHRAVATESKGRLSAGLTLQAYADLNAEGGCQLLSMCKCASVVSGCSTDPWSQCTQCGDLTRMHGTWYLPWLHALTECLIDRRTNPWQHRIFRNRNAALQLLRTAERQQIRHFRPVYCEHPSAV